MSSPREVLAAHSKSFALAGKLLPTACRDEAAVLYAWCRRGDDAIDHGDPARAAERLGVLRAELASVYAGEPQADPLLNAFQRLVLMRQIPEAYPRALLDGFAMDLGDVRVATLAELLLYAYRVAGVVGLMMCHVLGVSEARAKRHAAHLGMAMQLTNICRDVQEDWQRRRLYLPQEMLLEAGAPALSAKLGRPLPREAGAALANTVRRLLDLAESYYRSGDAGLRWLSPRAALSVRAARLVYSAIGREIVRRDCDVFRGRASVSAAQKAWLVVRAALSEGTARLVASGRRAFRLPFGAPSGLTSEFVASLPGGEHEQPRLFDV
jgi:phytoene synthase